MKDHGYQVPDSRFYAVVGDSEFGEGNYQEILPLVQQFGLDNIVHIVDYNRQSLDGNTEGWRLQNIKDRYAANGWQVIELKWGRKIKKAFARKDGSAIARGGEIFKEVMEGLPQEEYQDTTAKSGKEIREYLIGKNGDLKEFLSKYTDDQVYELFTDLGGHDLKELTMALEKARKSKKTTAIIAHTIKGWGLNPLIGDPGNHSKRLKTADLEKARVKLGINGEDEFPAFQDKTEEKKVFDELRVFIENDRKAAYELLTKNSDVQSELNTTSLPQRITPSAPSGLTNVSTHVWFGYIISKLRAIAQKSEAELTSEERMWLPIAKRIVTDSPDVATSTGVGKKGKLKGYSPDNKEDTHIRLGIEEMNAVTVGAALGKMKDFTGQPILPVVTIYDMFLFRRALDPIFYAQYWKSRMMLVGTRLASTGRRENFTVSNF
jgi:pyruvate dehydrogenase E1 component